MSQFKSYENSDPIVQYCTKLSVKPTKLEDDIFNKTLTESRHAGMLGAPEVLQLGKNFLRLIQAKKVLDIGTFTGASAVAWATALPQDGKVISMDVFHEGLNAIGKPLIDAHPEIAAKIDFRLAPALEALDKLIADGEAGTWDFAFIDADKPNYSNYYLKSKQLLRSGGVVMVDNALWNGRVVTNANGDPSTKAIAETNELIAHDPDVSSILLNVGDGVHLAFKN